MRKTIVIAVSLLMLAIVPAAQATDFVVRPINGADWYAHVSPTVTTELKVDDKSIYAKQLYAISGENNWAGETDFSASGCFGYDANRLYWHFVVIDDVITNVATRASMFLGDAFELGLAQSNTDVKRVAILMRPTASDNVYAYRPDGGAEVTLPSLMVTTARTANGWTADGSVLLSDVGLTAGSGSKFRLNVLVYDSDDASSVGQDTIVGLRSSADVGYDDMSVWSDAVWVGVELPEPKLLDTSIKKLVDGTPMQLVGPFVTLVSASNHCFFIEDSDRVVGLKVNFPPNWQGVSQVAASQIVSSIAGTLRIRNNQRELDADSVTVGIAGQFIGPEPMCVRGKDLGGSDPYGIVPRVGGFGPSNLGLLVKVVGQVKQILPTGFVLSSGDDIVVYYSGVLTPTVGITVSVIGAVTTDIADTTKAAIQANFDSLMVY